MLILGPWIYFAEWEQLQASSDVKLPTHSIVVVHSPILFICLDFHKRLDYFIDN
jgi:hypothetical protein